MCPKPTLIRRCPNTSRMQSSVLDLTIDRSRIVQDERQKTELVSSRAGFLIRSSLIASHGYKAKLAKCYFLSVIYPWSQVLTILTPYRTVHLSRCPSKKSDQPVRLHVFSVAITAPGSYQTALQHKLTLLMYPTTLQQLLHQRTLTTRFCHATDALH